MKKLIKIKLKIIAILILRKYKPKVVGITGSVGKSSAKEAISKVLSSEFNIRKTFKNYNNEFGLPLTIIGEKSPGKSYLGWFVVFFKALKLLLIKDNNYPEILVLEMGVDKPNDMDYLLSVVKPDVAVVTSISYSHLEQFGTLNNIKKEKQKIVEHVKQSGLAVLNYDSPLAKEIKDISKAETIGYAIKNEADLKTQDITYNFEQDKYEISGIKLKVNYKDSVIPLFLKNVISEPAIYAALSAIAVGIHFDLNLLQISSSLNEFSLPPGRMNILPGIKHSFLIDDTYNSSPEAALSAVNILGKLNIDKNSKKYAVMGEMLEIGAYSTEGHKEVGRNIYQKNIDILIAVGERARDFARGAKEKGMSEENIFYFDFPEEAGRFLQNRIKEGDVLLIKGSQSSRMEKVTKELMAEPDKSKKLLVRQDEAWLKK